MEAIEKEMQAMKLEKENTVDRAEAAEQAPRDANVRAEKAQSVAVIAEMKTDDVQIDPLSLIRNEVSDIQELQKKAIQDQAKAIQNQAETNQTIENKIQNILCTLKSMEPVIKDEEELETNTSIEMDKLSDAANSILEQIKEVPLTPENFKKFLMEDTYRKRKILPIARSYTHNIQGLVNQLRQVREKLEDFHLRSKDELKLDKNLISRINTLLQNMEKEMKVAQQQAKKDHFKTAKN